MMFARVELWSGAEIVGCKVHELQLYYLQGQHSPSAYE